MSVDHTYAYITLKTRYDLYQFMRKVMSMSYNK